MKKTLRKVKGKPASERKKKSSKASTEPVVEASSMSNTDSSSASTAETSADAVPQRIVQCPHCRKDSIYSAANPSRPFCSERCRMADLGEWASESYKIPTRQDSSADDDYSEDEEKIN